MRISFFVGIDILILYSWYETQLFNLYNRVFKQPLTNGRAIPSVHNAGNLLHKPFVSVCFASVINFVNYPSVYTYILPNVRKIILEINRPSTVQQLLCIIFNLKCLYYKICFVFYCMVR